MNLLKDAIKCGNCKKTLNTPILLPCGHSICNSHADEANDQIKCFVCGVSHQKQGFFVNLGLSNIINSQVGSMDFGPFHKEAKQSCDKLDDILLQINSTLKDPSNFTHTVIDKMKKKVLLKSEQLKYEIDENTQKLLDLLEVYEKECENNLNESKCVSNKARFESSKNESEKQLKEWNAVLNQLKVDENKWKRIKEECDKKVVQLKKEFNDFRIELMMASYKERNAQVKFFSNIDLNSIFNFDLSKINSSILTHHRKTQLRDLCKISPQTKWTLFYRGSRDGFGAKDFHSRCDNKPKTLTIIETTNGYIFGGYTDLIWNCESDGYGQDPNAYIFSLVNNVKTPFVMKIQQPQDAIFISQACGPTFGGGPDICICDNSNKSDGSYSNIRSYVLPDNLKMYPHILARSRNFQVKEIEVYQLEC